VKASWDEKPLGEVCAFQGGTQPPKSQFVDSPRDGYVRLLQIRDFKSDDRAVYVADNGKVKKCEANDIMIGRYGASVGQIHRGKTGAYNVALVKTIPDDSRLNRDYFYYYLTSDLFQKPLMEKSSRGAQDGFNQGDIAPFPVPLPPLEEQQQIVVVLDEAFEGLARARVNADANLQSARELFDEAEAKLFRDISFGSTETTLGELASFRNGLNYSRTSQGEEIKVVGVGDFQDNFTIPTDTLSVTRIDGQLGDDDKLVAGDILAVRSNGNRELIGRTMLMPEPDEPTSFSGFTIRIRLKDKIILPEYVCSYLRTKDARAKLTAGGGGANISNLNQRILSSFPVFYPEKSGQRDTLNCLEKLRESSKKLREGYAAKLQDIDGLRQSILQKAFAGQLTERVGGQK